MARLNVIRKTPINESVVNDLIFVLSNLLDYNQVFYKRDLVENKFTSFDENNFDSQMDDLQKYLNLIFGKGAVLLWDGVKLEIIVSYPCNLLLSEISQYLLFLRENPPLLSKKDARFFFVLEKKFDYNSFIVLELYVPDISVVEFSDYADESLVRLVGLPKIASSFYEIGCSKEQAQLCIDAFNVYDNGQEITDIKDFWC